MRKLWKGSFMGAKAWEAVYMAYRAGYDATGCMLLPFRGNTQRNEIMTDPKMWDRVQRAIDDTGIILRGMGNCIIDDNENLHPWGMGPSPDPDDYRDIFEFAGKHGINGVQTSVWTTNNDMAVEKFAKLCKVTGEYGIQVNLEFVAWGVVDDLAKARKLIADAGNPENARITIDLMHLYYSNVDPAEVAACPENTFGEAHICDVPHVAFPDNHKDLATEGRSYRLFPGETGVDYTPWLKAIPDNVLCYPEIPNKQRVEEWGALEYAARELEACKRYYRENGIPL